MASTKRALPLNWDFKIVCRDCGERLHVESVNPSTERLANGARIVILTIPNECPECHNLRVVPKEST